MINGYKTYIFSALLVVFSVLYAFGIITTETFLTLIGIFGGSAIASERHAIKKIEGDWEEVK
jgi:hypothetical protein